MVSLFFIENDKFVCLISRNYDNVWILTKSWHIMYRVFSVMHLHVICAKKIISYEIEYAKVTHMFVKLVGQIYFHGSLLIKGDINVIWILGIMYYHRKDEVCLKFQWQEMQRKVMITIAGFPKWERTGLWIQNYDDLLTKDTPYLNAPRVMLEKLNQ